MSTNSDVRTTVQASAPASGDASSVHVSFVAGHMARTRRLVVLIVGVAAIAAVAMLGMGGSTLGRTLMICGLVVHHYPSEKAWKAAIDVRHGRPLPLELLDLSREMPPEPKWPALVAATFAHPVAREQPAPPAARHADQARPGQAVRASVSGTRIPHDHELGAGMTIEAAPAARSRVTSTSSGRSDACLCA